MMRKFTFLVGAGVGFVVGSKVGSGPYLQLESKVRDVVVRPEVHDAVDRARDVAKNQVTSVADKLPSSTGRSTDDGDLGMATAAPVRSYADPQDLQFSRAAAEKEEMVDALLAEGLAPEELDDKEGELRQKGELREPRAGNKPGQSEDT
jgi:hypothetical protein